MGIVPCKPRGNNYTALLMRRLRAFSRWSAKENFTPNPFERYGVKSEVYGTPYYITVEERNRIADFDLSAFPKLSVQRDIFIFQCLVGCRVSDLCKLTRANVSGGFLEYVPRKTKNERAETGCNCKVPESVYICIPPVYAARVESRRFAAQNRLRHAVGNRINFVVSV